MVEDLSISEKEKRDQSKADLKKARSRLKKKTPGRKQEKRLICIL